MLLAALIGGVMGVFMPFVHIKRAPLALGLTAYELSFGMDKTRTIVEKQLPGILDKRLKGVRSARDDLHEVLEYSRWAALAFVPAIMLGILGAIGVVRRRVGRVIGALALPLAAISIIGWFALRFGIAYGVEEAGIAKLEVTMQLGAHLLLVVGGLGVLAAIGALIKPDPRLLAGGPVAPPGPPPIAPPPGPPGTPAAR
jgi:hypothetical protein